MTNLILNFYHGPKGDAIDLTYGRGSFWRRKPIGWTLQAFDAEPIKPECKKANWDALSLLPSSVDVAFFDPPYLKEGGFEFSRGTNYGKAEGDSAWTTERMKFGDGKMPLYLEKTLFLALRRGGLIVFKNTELQRLSLFKLRDYLIQDLGPQPSWFATKGKARMNHAFWMVFEKGKPE